jgi:putative phosphoesterase
VLIAVISDTHLPRGGRVLPEACREAIAASDLVIHAGDFSSDATLHELASLGPPLVAVHGNVDAPAVREALPAERTVECAGARVAIVHDPGPAVGRLERLRLRFPDADAVVFGHTHMPQLEERDGFQIFNPGSPTEKRRAPSHSFGMAEASGGSIRFRHVSL